MQSCKYVTHLPLYLLHIYYPGTYKCICNTFTLHIYTRLANVQGYALIIQALIIQVGSYLDLLHLRCIYIISNIYKASKCARICSNYTSAYNTSRKLSRS